MPRIVSDPSPAVSEVAAPLVIHLFGPMQVFVEGRPLLPPRSRKTLWLLALLVLRHGRAVEREWLAETLWPDADLEKSLSSLRAILSELRKSLGSESARLRPIRRHALLLNLAGADVDVIAFDEAIGSPASSQSPNFLALERAAALHTGPLLEGCAEEWAATERAERLQSCLQALQMLGEAAQADKDRGKAIGWFRRALDLDPWREAALRGLMEALAQSGDRNGALQAYREFLTLLQGDPAARPDEQTRVLYARIRASVQNQSSANTDEKTKREQGSAEQGYLPYALTELIGRDEERREVSARLRQSRWVTLTGPGGVGKTRLALAVAADIRQEYENGVWLAELEALSEGGQVTGQIASVLGLKESGQSESREKDEAAQFSLRDLTDELRAKRILLVLDNCEHLLEETARIAAHLLRECAGLKILATSREALGAIGEMAWGVPSLSAPVLERLPARPSELMEALLDYESVQLFVERAKAARRSFALTADNARSVAQVCARLDGIPLAIELAAARVRAMTVAELDKRLDDHLSLLAGANQAAQPRQQTLRATMDWSHALLTVPEQLFLARLSVFAGGWTLEAVEAICLGRGVSEEQGIDLLTSLIDKSLVAYDAHTAGAPGGGRYRLLETVRQYARERLETKGETDRVSMRHRDFFLTLAQETAPYLMGPQREQWRRRVEAERDNLRAAMDWGPREAQNAESVSEVEAGLKLASALSLFWLIRGDYREGRMYLRRALERGNTHPATAARAAAVKAAGLLADRNGDYVSARALYEQSLGIFQELGDKMASASALGNLNDLARRQGDKESAQRFYEGARALYEERLGALQGGARNMEMALVLHYLAILAFHQDDYRLSRTRYYQSLEIFRELGEKNACAIMLNNLGNMALAQGDLAEACDLYEQSLQLHRECDDRKSTALVLNNLGLLAQQRGDQELARMRFEESLEISRELGEQKFIVLTLNHMVGALRNLGDFLLARELQSESLVLCKDLGDLTGVAAGLEGMAAVKMATARGQKPETQDAAARRAACLWGVAWSLRQRVIAPMPSEDQGEYDGCVAQARSILGDDAFAVAWEAGCAERWEQAVREVLEE